MNEKLLSAWLGPQLLPNPEEIVEQTWSMMVEFDQDFADHGGAEITAEMEKNWRGWLSSEIGQQLYQELGERMMWTLSQVANCFDPTHDRHHMLMVDAASLRQVVEDEIDVDDWRRVQVIGAMAHDFGRVLEFKLNQQLPEWQLPTHGFLSLLVLQKVVVDLSLPADLRRQIYYSVAYHTGLKETWDLANYLGQAVQRADREQLLNLELPAKSVAHEVITKNYALTRRVDEPSQYFLITPGRVTGNDFWQWLETFTRNIELRVGCLAQEHQDEYRFWQVMFLYLGQTPAQRAVTFAPEIARARGEKLAAPASPGKNWRAKKILDLELWQKVEKLAADAQFAVDLEKERAGRSRRELSVEVLRAPQMFMTAEIEEKVLAAIEKLSAEEKENWTRAMTWTLWTRRLDDEAREKIMRAVQEKFPATSLEFKLAGLILEQLAPTTKV